MAVTKRLTVETSQEIAIGALSFLAGNPEALGRFLSLTGIGPADLRAAAREPQFLTGVLEFFMADESLLLAFAEQADVRPTLVAAAHHILYEATN